MTNRDVFQVTNGSECSKKLVEVHVRSLSNGNVQKLIQNAITNDENLADISVVYDDELQIPCHPRKLLALN